MPIRRLLILSILLIALALSGCTGDSTPTPTTAPDETPEPDNSGTDEPAPTDVPATPTPEEPFPGDGPWEVTFETEDGLTLSGTVYGQGEQGVILVPMYPGSQAGWASFAEALAAEGYRVLTFDLRGYEESEGERDAKEAPTDLTAALAYLREQDTTGIIVGGAGVGGLAAIKVAAEDGNLSGLIVLSSPHEWGGLSVSEHDLNALDLPSLWIGARVDIGQKVEELHNLAGGDKQIWIYEGSSLPGTFIFEGADGADLHRRLMEFVTQAFK